MSGSCSARKIKDEEEEKKKKKLLLKQKGLGSFIKDHFFIFLGLVLAFALGAYVLFRKFFPGKSSRGKSAQGKGGEEDYVNEIKNTDSELQALIAEEGRLRFDAERCQEATTPECLQSKFDLSKMPQRRSSLENKRADLVNRVRNATLSSEMIQTPSTARMASLPVEY